MSYVSYDEDACHTGLKVLRHVLQVSFLATVLNRNWKCKYFLIHESKNTDKFASLPSILNPMYYYSWIVFHLPNGFSVVSSGFSDYFFLLS